MKTGCRIVKDIKRPEKTLVDQFAGVAVANLDDCMGRMSAVHEDIVPVNKTAGHGFYRKGSGRG